MLGKLIALVLPLGLDTFAVAAGLGMIGVTRARRREITLLFTAFETGMPLIGLALGAPLGRSIGSAADYLAVAILIALIAVQTIIVTQLGLRLGHRLRDRWRERAERLAGVTLTTLGLVLLAEQALV